MPIRGWMTVCAGVLVLGFTVSARAEDDRRDKDRDKTDQEVVKALKALSARIGTLEGQVGAVKEALDGVPSKGDLDGITKDWDKLLAADDSITRDNCHSTRFSCIMPTERLPEGAAVLDHQTGLVWQRSPDTPQMQWADARLACAGKVGDIQAGGWRMPALTELTSLLDYSVDQPGPLLPPDHPFLNVASSYWTATINGINAWVVFFNSGVVGETHRTNVGHVWCVRSPEPVFTY